MARDRYLDRKNPWFDLFRVDRRPFHGGLWRYVQENWIIRTTWSATVSPAPTRTPSTRSKGEGKIVRLHGRKVAAYRDDEGDVTVCSPVCTHLKCLVRWNTADRTWDCPCHGSRFHATGAVLSGPAEDPRAILDRLRFSSDRARGRPPPLLGSACPLRWCAEGVARHHSRFVALSTWLRHGVSTQPVSTEEGAARQRLHPGGQACDRRAWVGQARALACSQNESGVPIILRAGPCWRSWNAPCSSPSLSALTFFCSHPRHVGGIPVGCLSDRRARWHKNCPLTVAIRARMTDAEAQWGAREQGAQSPLLRSHAWQRASLPKPARMNDPRHKARHGFLYIYAE